MYYGQATLDGEPIRSPNYYQHPFVFGVSLAVCDMCGRAVDTHNPRNDEELRNWRAIREHGLIVGFVCGDCKDRKPPRENGYVG